MSSGPLYASTGNLSEHPVSKAIHSTCWISTCYLDLEIECHLLHHSLLSCSFHRIYTDQVYLRVGAVTGSQLSCLSCRAARSLHLFRYSLRRSFCLSMDCYCRLSLTHVTTYASFRSGRASPDQPNLCSELSYLIHVDILGCFYPVWFALFRQGYLKFCSFPHPDLSLFSLLTF